MDKHPTQTFYHPLVAINQRIADHQRIAEQTQCPDAKARLERELDELRGDGTRLRRTTVRFML